MNMAKRKYSKMKKIEPSVQTLTFKTPNVTVGSTGYSFIDLSQAASLANRRFYRQGINWAVSKITVKSIGTGVFTIQKLPNTWVMSNAWEKSFRAWQQMIKNATDEAGSESIKGKFLDFKIFADKNHHALGFGANLLPMSFDFPTGTEFTAAAGQWQASDVTLVATGTGLSTDYELIAVGPNNPGAGASGKDALSIIQGYADSRALPSPEDPNVPADANTNWMIDMFDDGTNQDSAVTNMLEITGDNPPYPYEGDNAGTADTMYPGGETNVPTLETHVTDYITATTISGTSHVAGTNFPCGLMGIGWIPQSSSSLFIEVQLVPGTHRGYLCEPMTEM